MRARLRHHFAVVLVAVVLALGLLTSVQSVAQESPASALQLELVRDGDTQSVRPLFKVEMRNESTHPLTLLLGMNVGGTKYAGEIKFLLTDVRGRTRHLVKRDPQYIAGSVGPYFVTIPKGGSFEVRSIDLADYWSYEPNVEVLALPAGRYRLTAEYTGHNPNNDFVPEPGQPMPHPYTQDVWIGAVRSNAIAFTLMQPIGDKDAH